MVSVSYKCISGMMIKENLEDKAHIFTPKDYILQAVRQVGIILGQEKLDYSNLKLHLGPYCQLHEKTRNDMTPRTVVSISLKPKNDGG